MLAEGVKNDRAADGEDADGGESKELGDFRPELEEVGEERSERAEDAQRVGPDRGVDGVRLVAIAQTKLEEDGGQSDGGDHNDGERAVEGAAGGEDDDEREGSAEQAGGNDRPATWLGNGGQGFSRKYYVI